MKLATPLGGYVFLLIKFVVAIFVGHQVLISTKLFGILTAGFRDQSFCYRDITFKF